MDQKVSSVLLHVTLTTLNMREKTFHVFLNKEYVYQMVCVVAMLINYRILYTQIMCQSMLNESA